MKLSSISIDKLVSHPKNPNKHSDAQIKRLSELIQYQGWRLPIIVSNQTGFIISGHGRFAAAKLLGLEKVPVSYQDFKDEKQEYAFLVSDNAIASWAELDLASITSHIPELGEEFDINLFGLSNFNLIPVNFEAGTEDDQGKLDEKKPVQCPNCGEQFVPKS